MGNNQLRNASYACLIILTALAVASSCSENEADEMPTIQSDIITTRDLANATQLFSSGGTRIREVGKRIPTETAKTWIAKHQGEKTNGIRYHLFGRDVFSRLLAKDEAAGIRLCYAVDDTNTPIIVMVAVDSANNVLDGPGYEGYDDMSIHCPPLCPTEETAN